MYIYCAALLVDFWGQSARCCTHMMLQVLGQLGVAGLLQQEGVDASLLQGSGSGHLQCFLQLDMGARVLPGSPCRRTARELQDRQPPI